MSEWETYWTRIERTGVHGQVFWDVDPERAALEDLQRFVGYMNPRLPVVDFGCGNGRQTRFLARHFRTVIGVDISESAIALAISETPEGTNVTFRVLDGVNLESARALHGEFGDMNVYMRGVLHMITRRDRKDFINSLALLLGDLGTLYQIELTSQSILQLRSLPNDTFEQIPHVARRVGFNNEERNIFYPDHDWTVLDEGTDVNIYSLPLADGREVAMPANYLILKRRLAQDT